jgi:hypothetical protein
VRIQVLSSRLAPPSGSLLLKPEPIQIILLLPVGIFSGRWYAGRLGRPAEAAQCLLTLQA